MSQPDTALLILDMQGDLARPGGARYHERAASVIEPILRLRRMARETDWPILYTRNVHEPWAFDPGNGRTPLPLPPWCVRGTPGVEIIDACKPDPGETVVRKRTLDAFFGTELDFSDGLNGKGFVFNNPNAKSTCGCGTSFSV